MSLPRLGRTASDPIGQSSQPAQSSDGRSTLAASPPIVASHRGWLPSFGYDCGLDPWGFNQGLSPKLLGRMAAAVASLRVTLYPDREQGTAEPGAAADGGA